MKPILLAAAALAVAGCASSDAVVVESAPQATQAPVDPESIEIAAVVELEPSPVAEADVRCEQETVIGSRISRQRCYRALNAAEEQLNEDMKRSEIEFAREMALLEEQLRMEEMARRRQDPSF